MALTQRSRAVSIVSATLILCTVHLAAETAVSGQFGLSEMFYLSGTNGSIHQDTDGSPGVVHSGDISVLLSSWGTHYTLQAEMGATYTGDGYPEVMLPLAALDVTLFHWLTLQMGRFTYIPGNAEFRSPLSFLSQRDTEALFSGDITAMQSASELFQTTIFFGPAYLRLTAAPLRPALRLPDTRSIWFPRDTIPKFVIRNDDEFLLRSVYYTAAAELPDRVADTSILGEVSATLGPVDGTILGYSGFSNHSVLRPRVDLDLRDSVYDVALTPVQNRIDSIGAAVATSMGPTRVYLEGTYTWNRKSVMNLQDWQETTPVLTQNDPAPVYTSAVQEVLAGGSYQGFFDLPSTGGMQWVVLTEFFTTLGVPEEADSGLLSEFIGVSATLSTYRPDLALGVYSVVSWKEPGLGLGSVLSLEWQATPEVSVSLRHPVFLGDSHNELGQYRDLHVLRADVVVRF